MSMINKLENAASVAYNGTSVQSNTVTTLLLLPPVLEKLVDKALASVGDILTYTVIITNPGLTVMTDLPFADPLPAGCDYLPNSFKIDNVAVLPILSNRTLTVNISALNALSFVTINYQVTVTEGGR